MRKPCWSGALRKPYWSQDLELRFLILLAAHLLAALLPPAAGRLERLAVLQLHQRPEHAWTAAGRSRHALVTAEPRRRCGPKHEAASLHPPAPSQDTVQ